MSKLMKYFVIVPLFQAFFQTYFINTAPSNTNNIRLTNEANYSECGLTNATTPNWIVYGEETEPGDWPWMAYIRHDYDYCGGTLIDDVHVLTAAHCLPNDTTSLTVRLGEYSKWPDSNTIIRKVTKMILHPYYKVFWDLPDQPSIHDIAVITLNESVKFSNKIRPICLPDQEIAVEGKIAHGIGYGAIKPQGPNSEMIRILSGPVWSNSACQQRHDRAPVLDSHICAGETGTTSCFGDSGSALMLNENNRWYQVGVVGWGRETCSYKCDEELCENSRCGDMICDTNYPTVYARISYYLPWIKKACEKR